MSCFGGTGRLKAGEKFHPHATFASGTAPRRGGLFRHGNAAGLSKIRRGVPSSRPQSRERGAQGNSGTDGRGVVAACRGGGAATLATAGLAVVVCPFAVEPCCGRSLEASISSARRNHTCAICSIAALVRASAVFRAICRQRPANQRYSSERPILKVFPCRSSYLNAEDRRTFRCPEPLAAGGAMESSCLERNRFRLNRLAL